MAARWRMEESSGCKMMTKYYRDDKQACGVGGPGGISVKRKKTWLLVVL